jgi:putative transposase
MRKQEFVTGEYYHIYNRGVDKRLIFGDKKDLLRFVESILRFNQKEVIGSIRDSRSLDSPAPKALGGGRNKQEPLVSFVVYCMNPNHFHFVLKQLVDGGISKFMQKLQAGYTSYFNQRHLRSGTLLQGTFKARHAGDENYFRKIIGYVNKNYKMHQIPKNRMHLVLASDLEYENNNFQIINPQEAANILAIFKNTKNFSEHCDEMINIVKQARGSSEESIDI